MDRDSGRILRPHEYIPIVQKCKTARVNRWAQVKNPTVKTPTVKTPTVKTPTVKTPKTKTPKAKTPKAKTPKTKTPKAKTPKTKTPKTPRIKKVGVKDGIDSMGNKIKEGVYIDRDTGKELTKGEYMPVVSRQRAFGHISSNKRNIRKSFDTINQRYGISEKECKERYVKFVTARDRYGTGAGEFEDYMY